MTMAAHEGYTRLQIWLHWLVAILIIAAYVASDGMGQALRARIEAGRVGIDGNTVHVWLGGLVFLLILVRIIVRLRQGAPEAVPGTSALVEMAAHWGHRLLYLLMILVPASGAAAWYGGVEPAGDAHEVMGNALMIVALGHAAAALWHHFVQKDETLLRMLRTK